MKNPSDIQDETFNTVFSLNRIIAPVVTAIITEIFLNSIKHVKKGGLLFVPALTYGSLKGARSVIEGLIKTMKLRIEVPPSHYRDLIVASKT